MAKITTKNWPSVIDTLLFNDHLDVNRASENSRAVERQVIRNLETLFNTRRRESILAPHLNEAVDSLANFGIPDFTRSGFDSDLERRNLCDAMKKAIRNFEPRLRQIQVEDLNKSENLDRLLRFRITAELQVYPRPHRVVFDSRLDRASAVFMVADNAK